MKVIIEQSKLLGYLNWYQRTGTVPNYLELSNVENAFDFVAAVKQQISAEVN